MAHTYGTCFDCEVSPSIKWEQSKQQLQSITTMNKPGATHHRLKAPQHRTVTECLVMAFDSTNGVKFVMQRTN